MCRSETQQATRIVVLGARARQEMLPTKPEEKHKCRRIIAARAGLLTIALLQCLDVLVQGLNF